LLACDSLDELVLGTRSDAVFAVFAEPLHQECQYSFLNKVESGLHQILQRAKDIKVHFRCGALLPTQASLPASIGY
jgi:hypothetical protein